MKRFENVLLASDMDGTLLGSNRLVSRENREALQWFVEEGGRFCVATGRAVEATRMYFNDFTVNAPYICLNGSLIYDTDHSLIRHNSMPPETMELLALVQKEFPEIGIEIYVQDQMFVIRNSAMTERHFRLLKLSPKFRTLDELPPCTEWSKMNLTGEPELVARMNKRLQIYRDRFSMASSMPLFCETTSLEAVKGMAVAQVAELCGISYENVYTAGDSANDLSMIEAFHSFAPQNSDPIILDAAAEIVCDNDHGAIAAVIDHLAQRYPEK